MKQHLAAIRMLGDWLVVSQILPVNPAAAVRGPKHVVTKGAAPVLSPAEAKKLLESIDPGALARLRDRALLSLTLCSELEEPKAALFQSMDPPGRRLTGRALERRLMLAMIKRRAAGAALPSSTCCHTFPATGITAYPSNGGTLEHAQQTAGHASPKTTKLCDRTSDTVTVDEIERMVI